MKERRKAREPLQPLSSADLPPMDGEAAQKHIPVLYREVLSFVPLHPGVRFFDGTLGLGGHAEGMLRLAEKAGLDDAALLGLDRDLEAIAYAQERLAPFGSRVSIRHCCFSECAEALDAQGWDAVDFALVDIGVSSLQIDDAGRGFSFVHDGPLDMRMDTTQGQPASALVNKASVAQLKEMIAHYGEDPMAGRIARAIDDARARRPITTTAELAEVVDQAYPAKWRATSRNHPATRTFQALRMVVNDELGELQRFLEHIVPRLRPGGRVAVITFHSLEDRMVKHYFREQALSCVCPSHVPVCICGTVPQLSVLTRKPLSASAEELAFNGRAGSAKLRVAEKLRHEI